jgi:hypothetical protein
MAPQVNGFITRTEAVLRPRSTPPSLQPEHDTRVPPRNGRSASSRPGSSLAVQRSAARAVQLLLTGMVQAQSRDRAPVLVVCGGEHLGIFAINVSGSFA